jgi:hypothetical protein
VLLVALPARADRNALSLAERVAVADHVVVATVKAAAQIGPEKDFEPTRHQHRRPPLVLNPLNRGWQRS